MCDICYKVVTQSYDIEKDIKGSEIGDIIQYNNNMLIL